jgi:folate-binding protein YgfZ
MPFNSAEKLRAAPREPGMTEETLTALNSPTVLADFLAASVSATPAELVPYLGALTPRQLDAPEAETGALLFGAAVHDLGWLRRIVVRGEDRFRWLSGMVTNGVETLPDKEGAYNLVLNAQGRIQGDCYVWREGEAVEVQVTAVQSEALMAHFDRFIIMDDVELVPVAGQAALGLTGPLAEDILEKLGLPAPAVLASSNGIVDGIPVRLFRGHGTVVPHYALWTVVEQVPALWRAMLAAGAMAVAAESLETLRIAEGIPAYGIDIQSRDLAQETSQERALSFTKGCYLGQEIVERIRSRGQVHRHLRAVELTPEGSAELPPTFPLVGAELRIAGSAAEAKPAGTLTSVATLQLPGARRIFAITMIRAEAEAGNQPLTYSGGTARILYNPPKFGAA